jgi:hypothetical protein
MSSAVHNLQKAIIEGKPITQVLRQAKVIAANLNLADMEAKVDLELNGYPKGTEPPEYRHYVTHSLEIHNPYQGGWRFAGNVNMRLKAREPISQIEKHAEAQRVAFSPLNNSRLTRQSSRMRHSELRSTARNLDA